MPKGVNSSDAAMLEKIHRQASLLFNKIYGNCQKRLIFSGFFLFSRAGDEEHTIQPNVRLLRFGDGSARLRG